MPLLQSDDGGLIRNQGGRVVIPIRKCRCECVRVSVCGWVGACVCVWLCVCACVCVYMCMCDRVHIRYSVRGRTIVCLRTTLGLGLFRRLERS